MTDRAGDNPLAEVLRRAIELQTSGSSAVIAAVITNNAGLPVQPGARMLIPEEGSPVGSFDASVDASIIDLARRQLREKRSRLWSLQVSPENVSVAGMQGGNLDVFFETLNRRPRLVIVGAGHIAAPLAQVAKILDFEVVIVDDRPEFASRQRFPDADTIMVGSYRETMAQIAVDADTYVVLVTRGHVHDQACLELVVDSPAAYVGMIGSKRRVRTVMSHAAANGFDPGRLRRVHAPIGLDIGAQTPAEIAVAIAAEMVNVRRHGRAPSLALGERLRV